MAQLNTNNRRKLNVGRATKSLNTIEIKKNDKSENIAAIQWKRTHTKAMRKRARENESEPRR